MFYCGFAVGHMILWEQHQWTKRSKYQYFKRKLMTLEHIVGVPQSGLADAIPCHMTLHTCIM